MLRFSRSEDYAIILIHTLTKSYKKRIVPLSEVAKEYKISLLFLRNLASVMKQAGIIDAVEGKYGGYFLTKDPDKIKVGDVLHIFSPHALLPCCRIGRKEGRCDKEPFCEPGKIWRKLNQEFLQKISNMSLKEFLLYQEK
jgi:Rrf2 family protein